MLAMSGDDIFLPQMKTTLPPRKKERGKVRYYPEHLASICVHLRIMSCVSGVVINSGSSISAPYGGKYIFLRE